MAGSVTYVENIPALRAFLSWEGAPGRDFQRRMNTLAVRQLQAAPQRTGRMAGNIHAQRLQSDFGRYLEGGVGVSPANRGRLRGYAQVVSAGSRPHIITPRRARALRFVVAGTVVFTRRVNHPGTRPNDYLTRSLNEVVR
jgi:hypothetical protein